MKKILLSLIIIGAVGAVVAGVTTAYFSDTETAVGNTITAGTIDIKVNDANPWSSPFTIGDLKPGETDYMNLGIENVGMNPVEIYKSIKDMVGTTGIVSEPECTEQGGYWNNPNGGCNWTWSGTYPSIEDDNNIQTQILYDLSVKVYDSKADYDGSVSPIWWQTIETGDKIITTVYPDNTTSIDLGVLPVGGYMFVEQSYHFNKDAGNIYQGDVLTFNMEIKGEQLAQGTSGDATVVLENKSGAPDWAIVSSDSIQGTLTYKTKASNFEYSFVAEVKTTGDYTLIYVGTSGDYPCTESQVIGTGNFTADTEITISGAPDLGIDIVGGKVWLVPSNTYDESTYLMNGWDPSNNLYETGLVNYTKN